MTEGENVRLRVVMPVHNGLPYLHEALDSVLQDLPPSSELVVVDDGSTDGSTKVLEELAAKDSRVRLCRNERAGGVSRALNQGIEAAGTPQFVAVAEHDDVVLPGRFEAQIAALEADAGLGAVSSEGRYVGPGGRIAGRVAVGPTSRAEFEEMRDRAAEILVPHPAVTYRRAALDATGLYDPGFDSAQDLELINRMVYEAGWEVRMLRTPHVLYRIHDTAMSFSHLAAQRAMTRYIKYRNRCQLDGVPAVAYERWVSENRPDPRTERRQRRYDRGALYYRRAGLDWISGRRISFVRNLVGAAVLHPRWVRMKLRVARGR